MTTKTQAAKIGRILWTALTGSREEVQRLAKDAYDDVQDQVRATVPPKRPLNAPAAEATGRVIDAEFEEDEP